MDYSWIWKTVLIVLAGTFLLRIAGRKSIAQMTVSQTIIMIAIGTLLIQPVAGENIWVTFGSASILVVTLMGLEYIQLKFDSLETLLSGKSIILMENGQFNVANLNRYRMTVDQLEMQLRNANVTRLSDVEWATLEPNGKIGYALKQSAQPATKGDIDKLMDLIDQLTSKSKIYEQLLKNPDEQPSSPLFVEIKRPMTKESSDHLQ